MTLSLYPHILVTKGNKFVTLLDHQRGDLYRIDLGNWSQVEQYLDKDIGEDIRNDEIIQNLIQNDLLFEKSILDVNNSTFTKIANHFYSFSEISNIIIEIDEILWDLKSVVTHINILNVQSCELRFLRLTPLNDIIEILNLFHDSSLRSIYLYMPYFKDIIYCLDSFENINRLTSIVVYNSPKEELLDIKFYVLYFSKSKSITNKHCGNIKSDYFMVSDIGYFESLHYNSCLNRKLSIDAKGNIKNCPSVSTSFGNIKDTTLMEAIEKPGFKKYWDITKDKIHVCKDCEYRYVCTDCRAYIEDPDDILSKPLKCGYNPYTGEWSEWSTNPLKQKAIDFYGMREILPNKS